MTDFFSIDNNIHNTDNNNINNTYNNVNNLSYKKRRIELYKKNIIPILNNLHDKVSAILFSLNESADDCSILTNDKIQEFNDLMLELEIIFNDASKLEVGLNSCLIHTSQLLGSNYFNKLYEYKNQYKNNTQTNNSWKQGISKWIIPLFFYMMMLGDENSILNNPLFDKDYINKQQMKTFTDMLDDENIKYNINNDTIIFNTDNSCSLTNISDIKQNNINNID